MITPDVAQLIAAERIAERLRYAETARLIAIARGDRPSTWARVTRVTRGLGGSLHLLPSALRRRPAPVTPCVTC